MGISKKLVILLIPVFIALSVSTNAAVNVKAATNETVTASGTPNDVEANNDINQKTYGDLTYKIESNEITIIKCNESAVNVVIPEKIDGIRVTTIGDNAFEDCKSLKTIGIPSSVNLIGSFAFYNCTNLSVIEIPNKVTSINSCTFLGCLNLVSVYIPSSVTNIGKSVFDGCTDNLVIHGDTGSTAETYAKAEGRTFVGDFGNSIIRLNYTSTKMDVGDTRELIAISNDGAVNDYTYTSLDENIAKVDKGGKIVAIGYGNTKIVVKTNDGKSTYCNVVVDKSALTVRNITVDKASPQKVGTELTINADVTGGTGEYAYNFIISGPSTWDSEVSDTSSYSWTPCDAGIYNISVYVNDWIDVDGVRTKGSTSEIKTISFVVTENPIIINSFTANSSSPKNVGTPVALKAEASGGIGSLSYRYVVLKDGVNIYSRGYSKSNKTTWTPTEEGKYSIYVKVRDLTGKVQTKHIDYAVTKKLIIKNFDMDLASPQVKGTKLKLTALAEGEGAVQYRFAVLKGDKSVYVRGYNATNTATWTPTEAGTYTIYFKAKDESGKEVTKAMTYVIK